MTLEEAIKHCEGKASGCSKCADEHRQLAEWLRELKVRIEMDERGLTMANSGIRFDVGEEKGLGVCPLPCLRDEHGDFKKQGSLRPFIAKINEELDEFKGAIQQWVWYKANGGRDDDDTCNHKGDIAEEAADTITAITTMLEVIGIDAEMRDEAQRRVNEKNRKRNRL